MTDAELLCALPRILRAAAVLPPIALLPGERMALSGRLFREAPLLVEDTAAALAEEPALFGDIPVDPAALLARGRRAAAFSALHRGLSALAQQAADWALVESVGAIDEALAAVRQVRADADKPFPHPQSRRRRAAMLVPEKHLSDRQARKRRAARAAEARRQAAPVTAAYSQAAPVAAAAPGPPAQPEAPMRRPPPSLRRASAPQGPPPPSPQALAMAAAARARRPDRRAQIEGHQLRLVTRGHMSHRQLR